MNVSTAHAILQSEIESLPDNLVEEVYDFVLFTKARHKEEAFLWQQVEETRSYRVEHPEEVTTVAAEEWESLTAHWEERS